MFPEKILNLQSVLSRQIYKNQIRVNFSAAVPDHLRQMKTKIILLLFLITFSSSLKAQDGAVKQFLRLRWPVKAWVITHPFIAIPAWKISRHAEAVAEKISEKFPLDNDPAGGQQDAFRHAFWMASMAQKFAPRKAWKLGMAYEKGNFIDYKKGRMENGQVPDRVSCIMDLHNNFKGIIMGGVWKTLSPEELQKEVAEAVLRGELVIVKKDAAGNPLNEKGEVLPSEELKMWENSKVLVGSDRVLSGSR
jgi:hypothetical protein